MVLVISVYAQQNTLIGSFPSVCGNIQFALATFVALVSLTIWYTQSDIYHKDYEIDPREIDTGRTSTQSKTATGSLQVDHVPT